MYKYSDLQFILIIITIVKDWLLSSFTLRNLREIFHKIQPANKS